MNLSQLRCSAAGATLIISLAAPAAAESRLLMVEGSWCEWCQVWDSEAGGIYVKTEEGRRAPLMRIDIGDRLPEGVVPDSKPRYTPTTPATPV